MEFTAKIKSLRTSDRKVRLVTEAIKKLDVIEAENQLRLMDKKVAKPILKLLASGASNAMHNNEVKKDNLKIKAIVVESGPTMKRWTPRAFGRATTIRKRTCRIKLILEEKKETAKIIKKEKKVLEKPIMIEDYKSVPKGDVPEEKVSIEDDKKASDDKTEKKEIIDKSKIAPRHDPDISRSKSGHRQSKGFLKKIFTRKSV